MWRSETLAIVVSSTSMKVASETTMAISHGLWSPAAERGNEAEDEATSPASLDRHAGLDRHARADVVLLQLLGMVEHDLDRHALRHLDVVAGRVLGRQRAEVAARGALEALHVGRELDVGDRVDLDGHGLVDAHLLELRLLVVGRHPQVV